MTKRARGCVRRMSLLVASLLCPDSVVFAARGMKPAMVLATRVECDEESDGFGGKSDGNKQRGWQAIDSDKGDGDGNGDDVVDGDGDEAGGRQRGQG